MLHVTNSYIGWITQNQSTTELLLASSQSISSLISEGNSSCLWVLFCALGREELQAVMLGGLVMCRELTENSSTFTVNQSIHSQCLCRGTHTGRIQTLSFSTVFIN